MKGVDKVYALQAGREIRVIVKPEEIDDDAGRPALARDRPRDRGAPRVPGSDQGDGDPRVARHRVREVAASKLRRDAGHPAAIDQSSRCSTYRAPYAVGVKRYFVTTFGCQMNAHDSERIKGMLESIGLGEAVSQDEADVVVFNTCTIREKPDQRLAAHLAQAKALKDRDPERVIAVGGCYAEAQRERIFERYPFVDVAFGPGVDPAPRRLARSRRRRAAAARSARATSAGSRRCCRSTASGRSRPGCRSRWAATRSARTASSRPCAAARRAGGRARSSPRSRGLAARRRPRGDAARPERELVRPRPRRRTRASGSPSSCARSTRSTGSSGSASRARTRRTSAPT